MEKKNVAVLGAGFGGLTAAMNIAKDLQRLNLENKYALTLVDKSDCHLYTPLLYKAAASFDRISTCTYDTSSLIKHLPITFIQDEITSLDLMKGTVGLKSGKEIRAEYLVVATGSETNDFGIPGLKDNSLQLKTVEHALEIKTMLEKMFAKNGDVKIVIGGAGASGLELASEIRLSANKIQKKDPNIRVAVSILEAMPTILPGLDPHVQAIAAKRLQKLGIEAKTNRKITAVSPTEIAIDGVEKIPFDMFVWTGGIKSPEILSALPVQKEPRGKALMEESMAYVPGTPDLKLYPMVYGIGDSVFFMNKKTNRPTPAVARAAILEAKVAAHNLIEEIKKSEKANYRPRIKKFEPDMSITDVYVIPIGENWAVAKIGPLVVDGWLASAFESLVKLHYLASIMPLGEALSVSRR